MNLEKLAVKRAIEEEKSKHIVHDLFAKYEKAYEKLKNPSVEHQNDYIHLYFKYLGYMQERGERK